MRLTTSTLRPSDWQASLLYQLTRQSYCSVQYRTTVSMPKWQHQVPLLCSRPLKAESRIHNFDSQCHSKVRKHSLPVIIIWQAISKLSQGLFAAPSYSPAIAAQWAASPQFWNVQNCALHNICHLPSRNHERQMSIPTLSLHSQRWSAIRGDLTVVVRYVWQRSNDLRMACQRMAITAEGYILLHQEGIGNPDHECVTRP